jgi:hypothetical protein
MALPSDQVFKVAAVFSYLLFLSFFAGCVSVQNPKELQPIFTKQKLTIASPLIYKSTAGLGVIREVTLQPGAYIAAGRDVDGVWYLGPEDNLSMKVIDRGGAFGFPKEMIGVPTFQKGGIFVPDNGAQLAKIFTIFGDAPKLKEKSKAGIGPPKDNSDVVVQSTTQVALPNTPLSATPMQAGVGAGIAYGLIDAIIESDKKKFGGFAISPFQPSAEINLRKGFSVTE